MFKFCAKKCNTGDYALRIKNYAGMQWVSHNVILSEKFTTSLIYCANKWKRETVFSRHLVQRLVHSVTSSRASLRFEAAWICIPTHSVHFPSSSI